MHRPDAAPALGRLAAPPAHARRLRRRHAAAGGDWWHVRRPLHDLDAALATQVVDPLFEAIVLVDVLFVRPLQRAQLRGPLRLAHLHDHHQVVVRLQLVQEIGAVVVFQVVERVEAFRLHERRDGGGIRAQDARPQCSRRRSLYCEV